MFYKSKVVRFISHHHKNPCKFQFLRTFVDDVEIKFIRDRGLDHAVEREKDLKPMINLKNLLKLEPSKSLPLSTIVDNNDNLRIPYRPVEFIRKYPSVFEEYFPANIGIHPHVRLNPKSLDLDAEEQLIFDSDTVRKSAADRLLKLLMLCRVNEIPLKLIDNLKWDLGLPDNYVKSLVPEFPDYFQVKKGKGFEGYLELVCWNEDLAVSVMEKMAKKADKEYRKGMPIAFPLRFSQGFEMDKRLKKWIDDWQKLPYVSPYENAAHLQPSSDESDRWAVAVLHELLHILVPKKTERDNLLGLGEYLGVRSRFKRAIVHHPGIFYLSSKIGTHTVVLREGYKRGLLADKHPLMDMRSKYIHLMHTVKQAQKPKNEPRKDSSKQKVVKEGEVAENKNADDEKEQDGIMHVSDSDENENVSVVDDDDDVDDDEEDEEEDDQEQEERARGTVGYRSEKRGFSKVNEEDRGRGRSRSERRGSDRVNGQGQERGGNRSGRRGFNKVYGEGQERGGSRSGTRGFNRVNDKGQERGGSRSGRRGFSMVNEEGQARDGYKSGRRGPSKFNEEHPGSGRSDSSTFNKGHARSDGRRGRRGPGRVNESGRKAGRTSEQENSPRRQPIDSLKEPAFRVC